jgi:hypothetical protein
MVSSALGVGVSPYSIMLLIKNLDKTLKELILFD